MSEQQSGFVQQVVGQISNRMDELYPVIVQQPVAQLPWFQICTMMDKFHSAVGWADARKPNISKSQLLGFAHSPQPTCSKMQGFNNNLDLLFNQSSELGVKIKEQLAGLKYE